MIGNGKNGMRTAGGGRIAALAVVFALLLQPLLAAGGAGLRAETGALGRLAALIGPLCSIEPGAGAADRKAPAAPGHDRAGCCLPGCPMGAGPLPERVVVPGLRDRPSPLAGPPVPARDAAVPTVPYGAALPRGPPLAG
ncbi:hypothetical protein [Zavarzinia compransoris]|uniref:DUF2946 domain-containing protein n=1 Tax=Zavarzinia compransoris TaxID=1264899 RepID=A0A317E9I1_9PROT|nr:hypothetical protein [Zavarzinia compransoris]PWR21785.1 hypothetical protein DKG75_07285 [Zavarzinia compransoris]TDP45416.1 hypothetical protein DES42_105120 [Zavarzinia compransoris]